MTYKPCKFGFDARVVECSECGQQFVYFGVWDREELTLVEQVGGPNSFCPYCGKRGTVSEVGA